MSRALGESTARSESHVEVAVVGAGQAGLAIGYLLRRQGRRFVLLAFGQGRWEDPGESWRLADVLEAKGIPSRADPWDHEWDHDWPTWRRMLPLYLEAFTT